MIKIEKLTWYGGSIAGIEEATSKIEKGEVLDCSGLNAVGKTLSAHIRTGFLPASNWNAHLADFDVFQPPAAVKKRIGFLPENPPWCAEMTVHSLLESIAKLKLILEKKNLIFQNYYRGKK